MKENDGMNGGVSSSPSAAVTPGELFIESLGIQKSNDRFTLVCDKRLKDQFKLVCAQRRMVPARVMNEWMQAYISMYMK